jgi:hypothetical protein
MPGLRQRAFDGRQRVGTGRHDHCAGADQPGPGQQRDLDVRVARAFAEPGSGPVYRDAPQTTGWARRIWPTLALAAVQGLDRLRRAFC